MELILEVQTDEFWEGMTVQILETVRVRLRELIKLIDPGERKIVYTDFEDEIGVGNEAPLDSGAVGTDMARFKMKVRQFLDAHREHIAFQKVRRAEQLTKQDVDELERMLVDEGVADERRLGALQSTGGLGVFLRSLLGLDRRAAKEAFSAVLDLGSMTASQLQFIDLILNYLTERGVIEPAILYESPFTDVNDQGLTGGF
ncbi:MAG: hypothetical protein M3451_08045 [Chloroflexota bacterium]|nr:hypothetical protein [Chloroflexota bacterium]